MELNIDKTGWKKVKFGEVCRQVNETARNPQEEGLIHVVGLEHIGSNDLHIRSWNTLERETTFTRKFVKGQVLFGRRRAYQAKVAYANFDGICSGDILVFEAIKSKLLPELLPFMVQSQKFYNKAVETSAGSLSPRTKFKDLADLEFLLPPKDQQARLAELLWAADEVVEREKEVKEKIHNFKISSMSTLLNGKYLINNNIECPPNWKLMKLSQLGRVGTSGVDKKNEIGEQDVNLLNYMDVYRSFSKKITSDIEFMKVTAKPNQIINNQLQLGDVLFTPSSETNDDIGHSAVVYEDLPNTLYSYHLVRLSFDVEIDLDFKRFMFNNPSVMAYFANRSKGVTRMTLGLDDFNNLTVLVPPLDEQKSIAQKLSDIDLSIINLMNQISTSIKLKQGLINEIF